VPVCGGEMCQCVGARRRVECAANNRCARSDVPHGADVRVS